ncbi:hypothetical protein DU80_04430 [Methanosarcina mazei]|jgi:hypothetical protein|uniref:Uncharacterized protein n=3 Tax=Methanosarcina mazei TaxID=2209 RepID=A0A0F8G3I9_METMZ|nr:hypothetical protein [Methanosarcina mazei]AKB61667.1 hypothetical protein MSMAP_1682 [Methanosarcina mazei SarPi]KKG00757.1 hypothetical protein DU31_18160 [Methanosarcina mazei]KKG03124.1 hypothetical protein DU47_18095 [Methanosarcina mazei]KKG05707.1 hypothetical protein DU40_14175 [Methanosarcina mazei]KKG33728.1 hypothetical protein DU52_02295 [Methanosarcina mazei]
MKRDKFSGTRKNDNKSTSCTGICTGIMSVPKICSFSKPMQKSPVSEREKSILTDNKIPEAKSHKKGNYDSVSRKAPIFSLPSFIRIRATDKDGNTIEVTY